MFGTGCTDLWMACTAQVIYMLLISFQLFVLQFFFFMKVISTCFFLAFCDTFSYSQEDTITKKLIPVKHIKKHCRCNIPPPTELEHRIECVYAVFNSSRYSDGDIPLFGKKMPQVFAQLLVHVRNGCLSDVANVPLYRKVFTINYFNNPKHPYQSGQAHAALLKRKASIRPCMKLSVAPLWEMILVMPHPVTLVIFGIVINSSAKSSSSHQFLICAKSHMLSSHTNEHFRALTLNTM